MEIKVSLTDIIRFYRTNLERVHDTKFTKEEYTHFNLIENKEEKVTGEFLGTDVTFK